LPAPAPTAAELPPAPAQPEATIRFVAPACVGVPFDRARLVELLRVELRPLGVTEITGGSDPPGSMPAPALDDGAAAVVLIAPFACDEVAELSLTIADRATKKTVTRRLSITDVDAAGRPRVLAIAIAELLGASWIEFALSAPPAAPSSVPENAQRTLASRLVPALSARSIGVEQQAPAPAVASGLAERDRVQPRALLWSVDAGAITRLFAARSTAVLGGALGVSYAFYPGFRVHLSGEVAFGEADVSVGSITTNAATGSLGIGFATSGGPGGMELEIEPHLVLGAGWATGHAGDSERVQSRTYTDVLGIAAVSGTVRARAGRFTPFVTLELGQTFASVSFLVDATRAAGFGGAMFGARIGSGWDF
jgi:hypothetical protein